MSPLRIGITERGDASLDFGWVNKLSTVDGAILITKNITDKFMGHVHRCTELGHRIIVHCTCTGWGKTILEPNVPTYQKQLDNLRTLLSKGFPKSNCVLRIDPIIPTEAGLNRAREVLLMAESLGFLPDMRVRISLLDEFDHVKDRFIMAGLDTIYYSKNFPQYWEMQNTIRALHSFNATFELCAEKYFPDSSKFIKCGCVSNKDLEILGLPQYTSGINPQGRNGCLCLCAKTELLSKPEPCEHQCLYCYWKRPAERR